ncbi:MAG: MerR family transcriptional regulator [Desulfitobacteriaceae bacterium]
MGNKNQKLIKIGDLAKRVGVTVRTVRYYEELGLFPPAQISPGGFRLYTEDDLRKLNYIKRFKNLDFPLDEIFCLLSSSEGDHNKSEKISSSLTLLQTQLDQVEEKMKQLETIKKDIEEAVKLLQECSDCQKGNCNKGCPNREALI